ncbi:MAG: methyltransferase domain-containing protein [Methanothrix sp.]
MYTWEPEEYERSSSAQHEWALSALSELSIRGDERILDIGCGDGKITAHISQLVPDGSVLGMDISPDMISFARRRHSPERFRNLRFEQGDALDLRFQEEFDIVVSFACLHWIRDHISVLKGICRSLVPGGRMLVQCGGKGNAAQLLDITSEVILEERFAPYFKGFEFPYFFYTPEDYERWVPAAGLHLMSVKLIPKDMVHSGRDALEGFIRSTWHPYLQRLPAELRPPLVKEIADRYVDRYPSPDGMTHVRMMRLQALAEKRPE